MPTDAATSVKVTGPPPAWLPPEPEAVRAEELGRMPALRGGLVADEEVEPAVVVVVGPDADLGRSEAENARLLRGLDESDVATCRTVIAQERVRQQAGVAQPAAAQHQDVEAAVVVEVGVGDVESAQLMPVTTEPPRRRHVKRSVTLEFR